MKIEKKEEIRVEEEKKSYEESKQKSSLVDDSEGENWEEEE